jgi:hypothetical protein
MKASVPITDRSEHLYNGRPRKLCYYITAAKFTLAEPVDSSRRIQCRTEDSKLAWCFPDGRLYLSKQSPCPRPPLYRYIPTVPLCSTMSANNPNHEFKDPELSAEFGVGMYLG